MSLILGFKTDPLTSLYEAETECGEKKSCIDFQQYFMVSAPGSVPGRL